MGSMSDSCLDCDYKEGYFSEPVLGAVALAVIAGVAVFIADSRGASAFHCVGIGIALVVAWAIGYASRRG